MTISLKELRNIPAWEILTSAGIDSYSGRDLEVATVLMEHILSMFKCVAYDKDSWRDEDGAVLWWRIPICEPPYAGTPLNDDFPDYVTHWTKIQIPEVTP